MQKTLVNTPAVNEVSEPPLTACKKIQLFVPVVFYLFLAGLGLVWVLLGNTWYDRVVPFYDSLSYQTHAEYIIRAYQETDWGILFNEFAHCPNACLFKLVIAILAPVLPFSHSVLYIYLIPLHLIALAVLFRFLYRKTGSLSLALLGPLLFISTDPFRTLWGGILDQRMDLSTAAFALLLWVAAFDWAENSESFKKTITLGLVAGLAILHRPMISVQISLAAMMVVIYAIRTAHRTNNTIKTLRNLGIVALIGVVLCLPWFVFNADDFYQYYVVDSNIVGQSFYSEIIPAYGVYISHWIGHRTFYLIGAMLMVALALRSFSWKYFLLALGLVILPLAPLVLSGSNSDIVTQIGLAGIGLIPLSFMCKNRFHQGILAVFVLAAFVMAVANLKTLATQVNSVDPKERHSVEEAILNLANKNFINQSSVYLSGFISAGGGPAAIASVARLDLKMPLYPGAMGFHPAKFGLPMKATEYSADELDHAAESGLKQALNQGGILMLVDPSQVEVFQSKLIGLFANQLAIRMDQLAMASGRLKDTGVMAILDGIPVRFYLIDPAVSPADTRPVVNG